MAANKPKRAPTNTLTIEERIREIDQGFATYQKMFPDNFDIPIYKEAKTLSVTPGPDGVTAKVVVRIVFPKGFINNPVSNTTHGGAIATMLDMVTASSMTGSDAHFGWGGPGGRSTGITRMLQCTYLRPIGQGEPVLVESEILQISKNLATIHAVVKRESDGTPLILCHHEKFAAPIGPVGLDKGKLGKL